MNYISTVHNRIELSNYPFCPKPAVQPYLAFLGHLSPENGPQTAIAIAKQTGWHLKMAGRVDDYKREFFEREIEPKIDGRKIECIFELTAEEKAAFLGYANATLFPISRLEDCGIVAIESMATGTPVIAINVGIVPEIIVHGKTGIICSNIEEMCAAIPKAIELDRKSCRIHVEQYFSADKDGR